MGGSTVVEAEAGGWKNIKGKDNINIICPCICFTCMYCIHICNTMYVAKNRINNVDNLF